MPSRLLAPLSETGLPRPASEPPSAPAGGPRVAMLLAYDGSRFHGWQIQHDSISVQGRLEAALHTLTRHPVKVYGSGRTDGGVHALNQVAHFTLPEPRALDKLRGGLNALAGPGVAVKRLVEVPASFHARHSATGKVYRYHIHARPWPPVFAPHRCWWVRAPLDVAAMRRAAAPLLGTHDFSAFRASECAAPSPVRTLRRLALDEAPGDAEGGLRLELEATGFLQHMARILTGTLVAVGRGRLAPADVEAVLAGRERERAGATAPGRGLHLVRVHYDLVAFPELRPLLEP